MLQQTFIGTPVSSSPAPENVSHNGSGWQAEMTPMCYYYLTRSLSPSRRSTPSGVLSHNQRIFMYLLKRHFQTMLNFSPYHLPIDHSLQCPSLLPKRPTRPTIPYFTPECATHPESRTHLSIPVTTPSPRRNVASEARITKTLWTLAVIPPLTRH